MNTSSLGQRIRYHRKKAGLNQKDLATIVGMSSNAICHYEKDNREPNILVLMNIAKVLKVTADTLLGMEHHHDVIAQNRGEFILLRYFRDLNDTGQERALEYIAGLKELPKYAR